MCPASGKITAALPQAWANASARCAVAAWSLLEPINTLANGSFEFGSGAKLRNGSGQSLRSTSAGATNKAPRTRSSNAGDACAAQCATVTQPKL